MNHVFAPQALYDLRVYAYNVAAVSGAKAALHEWMRIEAALAEFADAPVDGVAVQLRSWPRPCRRHYVHPFRIYYERQPSALYVIRLYHHARRSIER